THYFPVLASTIQQLDDADSAAIAVGDVDGDGDVDAVFANFGNGAMGNANTLWFNDGEGNYFDSGLRMDNDITRDVALVDLDLDGDLDAYFANEGADKIWWNDGLGGFTAGAELLSTASSNSVAAADLDNDGDVDLVLMHAYPVPSTIWLNDGTGHFAQSGSLSGGVQQLDAALGDMDRDGDLDIMVVDYFLGKTQVWLNNGSGGFTPAGNGLAIEFATSVALGDLDGDGDLDAFVGRVGDNTVWLNNGSGILSDTSQLLGGSDTHAVALADFDSDGDLDAVTANSRPVGNKVWLNDGTGMFASAGFSWEDHASHDLAVADIDDDDDDDVLLANYLPLDSAPQQGRTNTLWRNILTFPDARDDHVTVIKNSSIDVSVIDNDTPDSDLRVVDIGSAPHGTPTNLGNGTVRFVPEPNYVGEATFEYTIAIDPVEIVANNGHAADWFGTSVSVDGKWAVVGAPLEDEKGTSTGAAYVYQRTGNHWTLQTKLTAPDWKKLDQFGQSVAI
ncbi:MAG: VCBS repeat-containing protein, partial [Planctomycetales bacterium]|nr:VCBS repeat-containing protein [Planctomycetales bacterium]